jgi:hypothetical protein
MLVQAVRERRKPAEKTLVTPFSFPELQQLSSDPAA